MAQIELAEEIAEDFERIVDHLMAYEISDASDRLDEILNALDVLERNPLIGRLLRNELRELVIGRRSRGYVALYRYVPELETVFVLAIRSQQESGYRDPVG
jgi:plasmid stabilization system protein ParE